MKKDLTITQQPWIPKNQAEQFMKSKGFKYPIKIAIYKWNQDADADEPISEYSLSELLEQYHEARMKEELIEFLTFREENTHYSYIVKRDKYVDDYLATRKNK